jgi:hypothetical protein
MTGFATKSHSSVTRGFPHLSSLICFALWRVCGELVYQGLNRLIQVDRKDCKDINEFFV